MRNKHANNYGRSLVAVLCMLLAFQQVSLAQGGKVKKTVFIIVDGIPADVIEKLAPPNLQAIAKAGGYTRAYVGGGKGTYTQTPTISAVGYNSVLTGTWVNKHNVWGNDISKPNYSYPTIFRYLKEQFPQKKTAIFSTWLDNRTKLVGDNLPATGNIGIDYHYDGLEHDTVNFPHDKKNNYLNIIDDSVSHKAANYIKTEAPDLSWVYLEFTDDMGHAHGDSPEFTDAIMGADKRVGYIWEAIQYRQQHFNEEWLIVITTDHGRDAKTGRGHGGQSERERSGWIFTNAPHLNEQFHQPLASVVDIMPAIAQFMHLSIPKEKAWEVDGISFTGNLSFINPVFERTGNKVKIKWTPVAKKGDLKIWITSTNDVKTGGKDTYTLVKKVAISATQTEIDLPVTTSFYKIVLEGANNTANYWIIPSAQ